MDLVHAPGLEAHAQARANTSIRPKTLTMSVSHALQLTRYSPTSGIVSKMGRLPLRVGE